MTYQVYVTNIADTLVDQYNLHPDDAVELIDMNKADVAGWYGRASSDRVARELAVRLRRMVHVNPVSGETDKGARWWVGGLAFGGLALALYAYANAKLQSTIKANLPSGVTVQPPGLTTVSVTPNLKTSINLGLSQNTYGMLPSVSLVFDTSASLSVVPATGIVSVQETSTGATVSGVAPGAAQVTINFNDPKDLTDAVIGIGVFA